MKILGLHHILLILCILMPLQLKAESSLRSHRVFEVLCKNHAANPKLSKQGLAAGDIYNVAIDEVNNVACVLNDDRSMVFFIYTNKFGHGKFAMQAKNGVYLSVGTSRSEGDSKANFAELKCVTKKLGSPAFEVTDQTLHITRVVSFTVDSDGRENMKWKD